MQSTKFYSPSQSSTKILEKMTTKFSHHQNILQPKRSLNSAQVGRVQKETSHLNLSGNTLTLNGVTIGLPSSVHHIGSNSHTTNTKKGPSTMAKRNARERNRVKQVNQGFQTLRQHIPEGYRLKKMSKVDTLRCALNYIRSMETVLEISSISDPNEDSSAVPYSLEDMNQHLDRICSETSISLDQSFSSFSENELNEDSLCHEHDHLNCHENQDYHHHQSSSSLDHQLPVAGLLLQTNNSNSNNVVPSQLSRMKKIMSNFKMQ